MKNEKCFAVWSHRFNTQFFSNLKEIQDYYTKNDFDSVYAVTVCFGCTVIGHLNIEDLKHELYN